MKGGVIVTGTSGEMGAATALELARRGFTVGCMSRRGTIATDEGSPEVRERLVAYACDITEQDKAGEVIADFAARAGGLQALVNNAGRQAEVPLSAMTLDVMRTVLEVNVVGTFSMCQLAHPHLKENGGGIIVNIGSFFDHRGVPVMLAYSASKAAIASMTRSLAVAWARDGISVVDVAPGYVMTQMIRPYMESGENASKVTRRIPVRRVGYPEEIGKLVAALIQERIAYLTGSTIYIDGAHGINL